MKNSDKYFKSVEFSAKGKRVLLRDFDSFNIREILECGQCFRFEKVSTDTFALVAFGKVLYITQRENHIEFYPATEEEFLQLWCHYFDLNTDYAAIKEKLSEDRVMKEAIRYAEGIRLLNQDPWETLISFILSQTNRIPKIKNAIAAISQAYGKPILLQADRDFPLTGNPSYYRFPAHEEMKQATEEELMNLKVGFRAKYIVDAIAKAQDLGLLSARPFESSILSSNTDSSSRQSAHSSNLDYSAESSNFLPTGELKERLQRIHGIGDKVSDCILLYSWGCREVFPIDVWVKRVMEHFYFEGKEVKREDIGALAREKFGLLAGFAQQYLFFYAREMRISVKNDKKISKRKKSIDPIE